MRSFRMLGWTLALLVVTCAIAQAKANYAYVANNDSGTVSVIDTSSNTVVKTITVGTAPYGVAVNQAGTEVYVCNSSSDNVSVISTSTNAVVATIPVQTHPRGVAFAPSGKTAYVANNGSNSVSVINTGTKKVTATITVAGGPQDVAVTGNGAWVYVTSSGSTVASMISTLTNTVVGTVTVGGAPYGMAIAPDGTTAYVANQTSMSVSIIQTANNAVVNTVNVTVAPQGATVSPDGRYLAVANWGSDLVTAIDTATQTVFSTIVVGKTPAYIAFTQDSLFAYVTNSGDGTVSLISTRDGTVVKTITVGSTPLGVGVMGTMKVSTVVGGYVGDKGPATSAALGNPGWTVEDGSGNLYISDARSHRIRKVDTSGTITTYAGTGVCGYNGENIKATAAMLCDPTSPTFDPAGDLVVSDLNNNRVRKITSKGVISTIAGNGVAGYSGDGGAATSAEVGNPIDITYDASGNLYISELTFCVIRKVSPSGTITTFAGTGVCGYNGDGIAATAAEINQPRELAFDGSGNAYFADCSNNRIRKIDSSGTIATFAGTGTAGYNGNGGLATSAEIDAPRGVMVENGVLYFADTVNAVYRAVSLSTNIINAYAGSTFGYDGDGHSLLASEFDFPRGIMFDSAGNPIFADLWQGRVRKATSGIVNTIAGGFVGDGNAPTSAALVYAEALAIDKSGNYYIADWTGNRVRKVSGGKISTIAGTGISGYSGDGGAGTSATLNGPQGIAVDSLGNVFIADTYNDVIREVNTAGTISTFATNSNFADLLQMATDSANNVYVADASACVIWKISSTGTVSIAAGVLFTCGYNGDGIPATTAQVSVPLSVTVDSGGNMYIADYGNNRVREVFTSGVINTVAGNGTCGDSGDEGPATSAELCPVAVAVDKTGTIYAADFVFGRIRKISGGNIFAFAGTGYGASGQVIFNGDGLWPLYTAFDDPVAVAVDAKGAVYVLDDVERRVRQIK